MNFYLFKFFYDQFGFDTIFKQIGFVQFEYIIVIQFGMLGLDILKFGLGSVQSSKSVFVTLLKILTFIKSMVLNIMAVITK